MPVLVKFEKDWSDEFDVSGFKIYNSLADWQEVSASLDEHSYWFGTNEGWDEGEFDDSDFQVKEISSEQAKAIRETIGNSFGVFPF